MPGAFEASFEFDDDPLRTAVEIQACGAEVLRTLERFATSAEQAPVDLYLVRDIHRGWFETTFPAAAGRERAEFVANRKRTAAEVPMILPGIEVACGNWIWRRERYRPKDEADLVGFAVTEANTLAVAVYDVHPFIDGNTRTTWHLRNYVLMLDGLRPLVDLHDLETYEKAWWNATPHDHEALDYAVLTELAAQDR